MGHRDVLVVEDVPEDVGVERTGSLLPQSGAKASDLRSHGHTGADVNAEEEEAWKRGNPLVSFIPQGLGLLRVIMTAFLGPLARIVGGFGPGKGKEPHWAACYVTVGTFTQRGLSFFTETLGSGFLRFCSTRAKSKEDFDSY